MTTQQKLTVIALRNLQKDEDGQEALLGTVYASLQTAREKNE